MNDTRPWGLTAPSKHRLTRWPVRPQCRPAASIAGKKAERAIASSFTPGGTHAGRGEFAGMNDLEVAVFLVVLPSASL